MILSLPAGLKNRYCETACCKQAFAISSLPFQKVLRLPRLCRIWDKLGARVPPENVKWVKHRGQYLISSATCRTDTEGRESDHPSRTKNHVGCQIDFNPITMTLQHEEDYKKQKIVYTPASMPVVNIVVHKAPAKNTMRQKVITLNQWKQKYKVPRAKKVDKTKLQKMRQIKIN